MNPLIQLKQTTSAFLVAFGLACFGLLSGAQTVDQAAPDTALAGGNTADGQLALGGLTTGLYNSAFGIYALLSNNAANFNTGVGAGTLLTNTGNENTATGAGALSSNTTPGGNTADGAFTLFSNTTGSANTAVGAGALFNNTIGGGNTAVGVDALFANTTVGGNTAVGASALKRNIIGTENTAVGVDALFNNDATGAGSGKNNTAVGSFALGNNTDGASNNAVGDFALGGNTTGSFNEALGVSALLNNNGDSNVAIGDNSLVVNVGGSSNTAVGSAALINNTGSGNTALGVSAGVNATTGGGNVYVGAGMGGFASEVNHTYIRNIKDTTVAGGGTDSVTVNLTTGLLGHLASSQRYKEDIKPMNSASEALYRLKPVTYRYKEEIDPTRVPAFGLIAEEVAQVNPDLVARNAQGQPESVHYEMVNAMLLNEFLKEHRKVEQQDCKLQEQAVSIAALKSTVAQQQKGMEVLTTQLREQASEIQKVSAQIEASKPAPQVVNNQ